MNQPNTDNPIPLFLSLVRDTLPHAFNSTSTPLPHHADQLHCALWLQSGNASINSEPLATGHGIDFASNDTLITNHLEPAVTLRFILSAKPLQEVMVNPNDAVACETLFSQRINTTATELLFRLDQVDFPPAAVAYTHSHPGPGIRYLVDGGLTLVSDHGEQHLYAGDAWFEEANSAVEATAIHTTTSCFVRTMLLPLEFKGRSTFTLQNQSDAEKPRLQSNIRHYEKQISVNGIH